MPSDDSALRPSSNSPAERLPSASVSCLGSLRYCSPCALRSTDMSRSTALVITLCLLSLAPTAIAANGARTVEYSQSDIVPIHAKIRFSTLIVLPASEDILDFTTGDKEFWIINGAHNLCYVHPAQAGIRSNLNLITASGHVYSFSLTEISSQPNADPDLKIFVEPKEGSTIAVNNGLHGYVSGSEAQAYK